MGTIRHSATLTLAAALGLGSILGVFATPASAEPSPELVLVLPGDTDPQGPTDLAPTPAPEPDPPAGPGEIAAQTGHGDPVPDLPLAPNGEEPECNPILASCDLTDVPDEDDCNPILASCDLTSNPDDPGDDDGPDDDGPDDDAPDDDTDRSALPRTGAGLLAMGAAGSVLTGMGVALRRFGRR